MFRCDHCKKLSEPAEKLTLIVAETRDKTYPEIRVGEGLRQKLLDKGGRGYEIVKETKACTRCAKLLTVEED